MSKTEPVEVSREDQLEVTDISYKSGDSTVRGKVYRLRDLSGPLPAIVTLPGRGRDFRGMEWLLKALSLKGYVTVAIGYRGLPEKYYFTDVEDAQNAISYLESLSFVDQSRIGIFGHSRGGMAALMAVASGDKRIKSVVAASASTDHIKNIEEKKGSAVHYPDRMRTRGTPPDEDPAYYRSISAIYNAHKMAEVPILLLHGARDFLVFVDHAVNMYGALKVAGNRSARLEIITGAGHFFERGFSGYAFNEVIELTASWFKETMVKKASTGN